MKTPALNGSYDLLSPFTKISKVLLVAVVFLSIISCNDETLSENDSLDALVAQSSAKSISIQNADFESGQTSWMNTDDTAVSSVTSDGTGVFDGDAKSIKVKSSGKRVAQVVAVSANTDYVLRAIIYGNGKIGVEGKGSTVNLNTDDEWKQLTHNFNSGSSTSVTIFGQAASSDCRFDNFTLDTDDNSAGTTTYSDGTAIAFRAAINERYVVAERVGTAPLIANRPASGTWEIFYITNHSDGRISLKSFANGKYVAAVNETTALIANQSTITDVTKFTLIENENGTVSLKASNGKYVVAELAGSKALFANRSVIGPWEQFHLVVLDDTDTDDDDEDDELNVISTGNYNLNPNKAPSENFDLSKWKITLSSGDEVEVSELNANFTKDNQFYTDPSDGGMVFKNYPKGAGTTTSSSYSRVEFREMLRSYNDDIDTKGLNANNWVFSSSSNTSASKSGGVDGILKATLKVNRVTITSDEIWQVGRIIIGQIHAEKNEPCRLYYHKQPHHDKGALYLAHESRTGKERFYNIIGNYVDESDLENGWRYNGAGEPSNGIALNEDFSYIIEVKGNTLDVAIYNKNGGEIASKSVNMDASGYENSWVYFKAGLYSGNKSVQSSSDHEKVTFYSLAATHD